jgi:Uma2 family endonuclease
MALPVYRVMTVNEYLAFERTQIERHAYDRGVIIRQAGGSQAHALLSMNIAGALYQHMRTRPCMVYGSDMRIGMPHIPHYVYPDVSVVCGESMFYDDHRDVLLNPIVIIEVLSPSTERKDRGKTFQDYQQIPSFQEYVLVAQDTVLIEHFTRQHDYIWTFEVLTDRAAALQLHSIQCTLSVDEIYAKVALADELPESE